MYEQLDELAICHQELGDEVYIPIPAPTVLSLIRLWEPELGEEVLERGEGGGLAPVVLVAVHVQHLLAGHGEHS